MGASVNVGGAHPGVNRDQWFACEQPERPTDPYVMWHYRNNNVGTCLGCAIKADVLSRMHPDDQRVAWVAKMTRPAYATDGADRG